MLLWSLVLFGLVFFFVSKVINLLSVSLFFSLKWEIVFCFLNFLSVECSVERLWVEVGAV